jgi:hypothetical protein
MNPLKNSKNEKILFPTDFSTVATNAFVHALFAKIVHGELVLLHSFEQFMTISFFLKITRSFTIH